MTTAIADTLKENYKIDPVLFDVHDVNRGLRKKNGTGVLCGLNRIGDVHGYEIINGVKTAVPGVLYYRGIDMSEIAKAVIKEKRYGFEEVVYLLMLGTLPDKAELRDFTKELMKRRVLPKSLMREIKKISGGNMMNKLARCVLALHAYDIDADSNDLETVFGQCLDLIARFHVLLATIHNPNASSNRSLSIAENFLSMIRADGKFTELEARVLDLALILHAEHGGGTNSTFSVHVVSSTGTDTYSSICAAICALKGPKHGGANSEVLKMMHEIKENVKDWADKTEISNYLAKIIRKEAGDGSGLIYGMGHAVYTVTDPRAILFKEQAIALSAEKGFDREMKLYLNVAELAPKVFAEIKGCSKMICANVDFFTGFIYEMMGIPEELCTPIFAMSRVVGWCAHRIDEMINSGRIIRPAYKDVSARRAYIPLSKRMSVMLPKKIEMEVKV